MLDQTNEILLTVDYEHNKFHHSSFVAGAPVIAAGEMIISRGRLIALTNHSGHYLPPPSCISYVMVPDFERTRQSCMNPCSPALGPM